MIEQRPKYGNRVTYRDGKRFASVREADRYSTLTMLERAGKIFNLRLHTRWPLTVNGVKVAEYEDDFNYTPILDGSLPGPCTLGDLVVEDAKGMQTPVYRLKKRLMKACHGIDIQEV